MKILAFDAAFNSGSPMQGVHTRICTPVQEKATIVKESARRQHFIPPLKINILG